LGRRAIGHNLILEGFAVNSGRFSGGQRARVNLIATQVGDTK